MSTGRVERGGEGGCPTTGAELAAAEDRLFDEWRTPGMGFNADGAVDPAAFLETRTRILVLLKEPNLGNDQRATADLRAWLRVDGNRRMWRNLAQWIAAIRLMEADPATAPPWERYADATTRRREVLRSIAAVNVRKRPGGGTADPARIWADATRDVELLDRQIALYDPHIVVLGGKIVGDFAGKHLSLLAGARWSKTSTGRWYTRFAPGRVAIGYVHPAARRPARVLAEPLVASLHEVHFAPKAAGG